MEISKDVPIVGIDYRDKPQNGIAMLERMGQSIYTHYWR